MTDTRINSPGLNGVSRGRMPGEQCVQSFLDDVVRFRERWQRFASASSGLWERFRSQGALLPAEFLTELETLQSERTPLLQRIRQGTATVELSSWRMPDDDTSLVDLEESLKQLLKVCRESQRQFVRQQQAAIEFLQSATELRSDESQVQSQLQALQPETQRELQLLESCRYGDELQIDEVLQPWKSFYLLIVDGQRGRGNLAWVLAMPELSVADCEQHFAVAERRFERGLVLQTLRGLVHFAPGSEASVTAFLCPERVSEQQRASVKQLEDLQLRFPEKPATVVRTEPTTTVIPLRAVGSPVAVGVTQPATVQGSRLANVAELELLQERVRQESQGSVVPAVAGAASRYAELLLMLGESIQFVITILKARGEHRGQQAEVLQQSLQFLAEAQSMLRHWQEQHRPDQALPLQVQIFYWLKDSVAEDAEAILLQRYMKLSDVADSNGCSELREQILAAAERWQQQRVRSNNLAMLLGKIDHLGPESATNGDWVHVDRFYRRFIDSGGSPELTEVRERLSAKLEFFPDFESECNGEILPGVAGPPPVFSETFQQLLNELQTQLDEQALQEPEQVQEQEVPEPESADVVKVRRLLAGQRMALVGGVVRPLARDRIKRAFELADLEWIPASKKDRVSDLEPRLRGVKLVVLVTCLIGHKHNDLRPVCEALQIPWVQTPKRSGYGVNQLAHQIVRQASERLGQVRAG